MDKHNELHAMDNELSALAALSDTAESNPADFSITDNPADLSITSEPIQSESEEKSLTAPERFSSDVSMTLPPKDCGKVVPPRLLD